VRVRTSYRLYHAARAPVSPAGSGWRAGAALWRNLPDNTIPNARMLHRMRIAFVISFVVSTGGLASAEVVNVTTAAELMTAISDASPGDEIVLASGTYRLTGVTCAANGTQGMPIVVRSAEPLGAKIELDGVEGFKVTGAHWQFDGLDIVGVCANDSNCEHAFHVTGAAHDFVLRNSRVRDFNAQVKSNAARIDGTWVAPNRGRIENNDIGDTRGRRTENPVTKLNIDGGEDWVIRGNYIHDFYKTQGNQISYGAFFKSGSKRGVMEQNLVLCEREAEDGGYRIGLSLGGGGTDPQYCAPAYDASVPCSVEHDGGIIRNNIIANCSDVGVYLNRAKDSKVLYNTMIQTGGVDFRYETTSGEAVGNVLSNVIRTRNGAQAPNEVANVENVLIGEFEMWYRDPLAGDLEVVGNVDELLAAGPTHPQVTNDYCGRARPSGALTLGAVEHSLGPCDTQDPGGNGGGGGGGGGGGAGAGGDGDDNAGGCGGDDGGCQSGSHSSWLVGLVAVALGLRRRRRS
jgi:MYXO-CTERM domain-containing protein